MNPHDIREKTVEEIKTDLLAAQENLRTLTFQQVTSQLENTALIKKARRDIARMKTVLNERASEEKGTEGQSTAAEGSAK